MKIHYVGLPLMFVAKPTFHLDHLLKELRHDILSHY